MADAQPEGVVPLALEPLVVVVGQHQPHRRAAEHAPPLEHAAARGPVRAAQRGVATAYIAQLSQAHAFAKPIVTRIESGAFFPAEDYHQNFYDRNPNHPYIVTFDKPKVAAFRAGFPQLAS